MKASLIKRLELLEQSAWPDPAIEVTRMNDPAMLMEYLGMVPDRWQRDFLCSRADRILCLAARQTGKSTCLSAIALFTMLHEPNSLVLIAAPVGRQSNESYQKVVEFYRRLGRPVPPTRELRTELCLENGSRCVSLPGDPASVRGYSRVHTCIIDECAQVDEQLPGTLLPMLVTSRGRCICASTPFGRRGFFYDQYMNGGAIWERHVARASMCPRYDAAFVRQSRKLLGDRWCDQEFECEFVDAVGAVFSAASIQAAFRGDVSPLPGF
jgi:hypothetical protein